MIDEDRKAAIKMLVNAYYRSDEKNAMTLRQYLLQVKEVSTLMTDEDIKFAIWHVLRQNVPSDDKDDLAFSQLIMHIIMSCTGVV